MSRTRRIRALLSRHLYAYLAVLVGISVAVSIVVARQELVAAWRRFDASLVAPILALTLANYFLRFLKWQMLLGAVGVSVGWASSARIFFACLSMVVTPARLGELYKAVFLRRLHAVSLRRTAPVLVVERLTDVIAVLALAAVQLDRHTAFPRYALGFLVLCLLGGALAVPLRPPLVRWLTRLPGLGRRADAVDQLILHHAQLLRPVVLGPALVLSTAAWFAECYGLALVMLGLDVQLGVVDATWVYAVATALGNVTFLPGGLGSTEATLVGLLRALDVSQDVALAATILVRAATLWFAVFLGLLVSAAAGRRLQWSAVRREAAQLEEGPRPED